MGSDSGGNQRIASAVGETGSSTPKTVSFSQTISKVFPKTRRELMPLDSITEEKELEEEEDNETQFDITDSSVVSSKDGEIKLEFFAGGEENKDKLYQAATQNIGILTNENKEFIDYLSSRFGSFVLAKNKLKIHLESGKIFHDNNLTGESLYDFLNLQQDIKKKELKIEIPVGNDFGVYVREILSEVVDDDFDLLTNSTRKFLFYNFNTARQILERKKPLKIRHSQILDNETAIKIVQSHNWQYFIERLLQISNNDSEVDPIEFKDDEAFKDYLLIEKSQEKLNYCKRFYEEVFNDIAYFLHKKIKETPDDYVEKMEEDLANERIFYKKLTEIESHVEFLKIFSNFYFKTGRFPGNTIDLMMVPLGVKPSFVESEDQISTFEINEKFKNSGSYGLALVQFIAALHGFFGGNKELSKNVMSEFLQNLSSQALTIDDDSVDIGFDQIIELNRNLKSLIKEDERNDIQIFENHFQEENFEIEKDRVELIEEEVVSNIINNTKIDHPNENFGSFPNTKEEIQNETNQRKKIDENLKKAVNQRDEEISSDMITEQRNELIKSMTDNVNNLSEDVLNNAALSVSPDKATTSTEKETVEEHFRKTIKKDNQKFYERKKSSVKLKLSPAKKSPRKKLTDLLTEEEKKPYDKE